MNFSLKKEINGKKWKFMDFEGKLLNKWKKMEIFFHNTKFIK